MDFEKSLAVLDANLGGCRKCMRRSLAAAVAAWGGFGLCLLLAPSVFAQTDKALAAIIAHPVVKQRMAPFKIPLVWLKIDDTPGLDCYQLKESHPTHTSQVDTYCRDRASGKILIYDVVNDKYSELRPGS